MAWVESTEREEERTAQEDVRDQGREASGASWCKPAPGAAGSSSASPLPLAAARHAATWRPLRHFPHAPPAGSVSVPLCPPIRPPRLRLLQRAPPRPQPLRWRQPLWPWPLRSTRHWRHPKHLEIPSPAACPDAGVQTHPRHPPRRRAERSRGPAWRRAPAEPHATGPRLSCSLSRREAEVVAT